MGGTLNPSVVCVGANLEAEAVLKALVEGGVPVAGLVTLPAQNGAGVSDYRDLHPFCDANGITVVDTQDINAPSTLGEILSLAPNYIFVLGWSQLLRDSVLSVPEGFVVGSHPTPLPERRGRAPVPWTILEAHRHSAVTLFRMQPGVDDGPILAQRCFDVPERAYAMDLYEQVSKELAIGFVELYWRLVAGDCQEHPQSREAASYRARRTPADGWLDFSCEAEAIDRLVRAVSEPFPGAYTYFDDRQVHVWRSKPYEGLERRGVAGQILARDGDWLIVQAGDKPIALSAMTCAGEPLPAGGFPLGVVFGYRLHDTLAELRRRLAELERRLGDES